MLQKFETFRHDKQCKRSFLKKKKEKTNIGRRKTIPWKMEKKKRQVQKQLRGFTKVMT
jgi:hypothetical protein